ncbi:toxic anion resistance protein [Thalassolituus sp.]|uniref:toxic anion resistance protein n=1 Tax=Thalassolituus sp. TaxID=2030822 RepID=UPI003518F8FA
METNTIDKPVVKTKEVLMPELNFSDPNVPVVAHEAKPQIAKQADELVVTLLAIEPQDLAAQQKYARAVQTIGEPIQAEIAKQSQMLKAPMTALIKDAEDGGKVANGLLNLQEQVSGINPNRVDFTMGTIRRLLAKIPGFGTPLSRWFAKYQAVDSLINDIIASLKDGRGQLERDNETLRDDQIRMRELTFKLEDYIALAQLLDQKLAVKVTELDSTDERRKFIEEELLFPIKQRVIDLQQQLAVNQQGVLASEVIIRNNRELIIGVNRALNVTITALNTAATLQIALQHQKKVLEGVEAVTQTTNDLIAGTAEQLKTQGAAIQKQASQATLDIETLKKAFSDVQAALDDISQFRRDALPQMAQSIVEMDGITGQMEQTIQKLEKGTSAADVLILEVADA